LSSEQQSAVERGRNEIKNGQFINIEYLTMNLNTSLLLDLKLLLIAERFQNGANLYLKITLKPLMAY
jgi:hypothetical protein